MKTFHTYTSAIALALFAALPASASSVVINFDNVASGATATSAAPAGISFHQAIFSNDVDAFGDEIPNTEKWKIDTDNDVLNPVLAASTLANNYGVAPSGINAMDAREQAVLMHFDTATDLSSFQFTLDNSTFGDLTPAHAYFVDANKQILATLVYNEAIPGAVVASLNRLFGVQDVVFSASAFYDNIAFSTVETPVPLPAALPLLLSALGLLGGAVRKAKA